MQIGSEYRHKTITSTFLATPERARVMARQGRRPARASGRIYGLISLVGSVIAGAMVLTAQGLRRRSRLRVVVRTLALSLLVLGLWALIGLGVGILIPNQVAALLIAIGVAWIIEPLVGFATQLLGVRARAHRRSTCPTAATSAMVNGVDAGRRRTPSSRSRGGAAPSSSAAYAAVLAGFGSWRTVRSDIS